MKLVCLSDFHGKKELLGKFIDKIKAERPDLVLFAGDMVRGPARMEEWLESRYRGREPNKEKKEIKLEEKEDKDFYSAFYQAFGSIGVKIMMVPGNLDAPWFRFIQVFESETKSRENIILVHGSWIEAGDYLIGGFGGEITESGREDFFVLQFPAQEVKEKLGPVRESKLRIMIFHIPPYGHLDTDNGQHKGIEVVRELIEKYKPLLVTFGHSHKAQGKDFIGDSLLVNPGAMKDGNGAVVQLEKKEVEFFNVL